MLVQRSSTWRGVILMHQEGSGLGVVLWVTKNHQQASFRKLAGVQIFQSMQLYIYIYIDPTWETSSTLERFWFATVATAGGHRFRLFKGGILKRCFPLEDACFPHCGNPGASHQHPRFFSMLSMWVAPYNKPCDLTPWWWQKNGGTQAPRASFASSTRPLKRPKFQQLLQLSAVTSDRFIKHQEMEATFGYQRILTMLFIIIIIIPILGSTIPYIP